MQYYYYLLETAQHKIMQLIIKSNIVNDMHFSYLKCNKENIL